MGEKKTKELVSTDQIMFIKEVCNAITEGN